MDYCCQLWSPQKKGNIQKFKQLKKSFLRKIAGCSQYDYWELLKTLPVSSLQHWREEYAIIYTWRGLEGQVPNFGIREEISKGT